MFVNHGWSIYFFCFFCIALLLANLPFLNHSLFACLPLPRFFQGKTLSLRLIEWLICYLITGWIGRVLEAHMGEIFQQGWQFYVITLSLFCVMASPGFIYRYLICRLVSS